MFSNPYINGAYTKERRLRHNSPCSPRPRQRGSAPSVPVQNEKISLVSTYGALFTFRFSWMR
jgi:hypothetical protein